MTMKIAVLGAGAMGSLYGGHLAEGGHEVWLLDVWKEHVDAVNQQGLYIEGISGERYIKNIKASTNPAEIGNAELVLVFVKSTITDVAVSQNKELFGSNTIVLTLQNGLGNIEKISQYIEEKNIIAGITAHGATMLGPGRIKHAGLGKTNIGELNGSVSSRVENIVKIFNDAKLETFLTENVLGLIWGKLLVNVGINALTAITGLKNGQLLEFSETDELLEMVVEEAYRVALAKGIKLTNDNPVEHTREVCRATAENRSSMLQDVTHKRKTEIDMINGAIVKEGAGLEIDTPINKALTNLISVIQKTY